MQPTVDAGGLTGWVLDVVDTVGQVGVGLLVLLENLVPPIPSEVVLPFSGALAAGGRFTFVGVLVASTIGSVLGALLLYEAGRRLGQERIDRWLAAIPLVSDRDVERAESWFAEHGTTAVLSGRLVPGVRSLVSVPAGAQHMPRGRFLALTTLGSAVWNAILLGAGYALGRQWQVVEQYTVWLDVAMGVAVLAVLARLAARRWSGGDEPRDAAA